MENDIREIFGRYNNDKSGREKIIATLILYITKEKAKAELAGRIDEIDEAKLTVSYIQDDDLADRTIENNILDKLDDRQTQLEAQLAKDKEDGDG